MESIEKLRGTGDSRSNWEMTVRIKGMIRFGGEKYAIVVIIGGM